MNRTVRPRTRSCSSHSEADRSRGSYTTHRTSPRRRNCRGTRRRDRPPRDRKRWRTNRSVRGLPACSHTRCRTSWCPGCTRRRRCYRSSRGRRRARSSRNCRCRVQRSRTRGCNWSLQPDSRLDRSRWCIADSRHTPRRRHRSSRCSTRYQYSCRRRMPVPRHTDRNHSRNDARPCTLRRMIHSWRYPSVR